MKRAFVLVVLALFVLSLTGAMAVTATKSKSASKSKSATCPMTTTTAKGAESCPMMTGSAKAHDACPMMGATANGAKAMVCPVTGKAIKHGAKSVGKGVYKGKTYTFCDKSCKAQFDKNPGKYVKTLAAKQAAAKKAKPVTSAVCPVMGNKIPDITKAAGKSVYKGKTYYFCCPACKPLFDKNPKKYVH